MKILTKNNEIIAISKVAEIVANGIRLDDYIIGIAVGADGQFIEELPKIHDIETVPAEVVAEKYCYTEEKGFYLNEEYNQSMDATKEIDNIKKQLDEQNKKLDQHNKKLSEQNEAMAEMMNLIALQGIAPTK